MSVMHERRNNNPHGSHLGLETLTPMEIFATRVLFQNRGAGPGLELGLMELLDLQQIFGNRRNGCICSSPGCHGELPGFRRQCGSRLVL